MTDNDIANQGREAADVIENPAYQAALASLKLKVVSQLLACPVSDREQQVLLIQLAKLTDKFDSIIYGFMQGGKLAQEKINLDSLRNESSARKLMRRVL